MDKSKIIAVTLLVVIGGALLYTKSQDPAAPSGDDHDHDQPQPTAIAKVAPDESATAINNAANAEVAANAADTNVADTNVADTNVADSNAADSNVADTNVADATKLKITDERVGTGPVAKVGDTLSMNYKGMLTNGKVFDQSYGRGPFDFPLGAGQVIKGWDEGIVGMKVGGKRKLIIPPDLGYGDQGAGADIPPGATLIFEVELLSVNGKSS